MMMMMMMKPDIERWSPNPLLNTLPTRLMGRHMHICYIILQIYLPLHWSDLTQGHFNVLATQEY